MSEGFEKHGFDQVPGAEASGQIPDSRVGNPVESQASQAESPAHLQSPDRSDVIPRGRTSAEMIEDGVHDFRSGWYERDANGRIVQVLPSK